MSTQIEAAILRLLVKRARSEKLTDAESGQLNEWCRRAPENEDMLRQVSDPKWINEALQIMDEVSDGEMWREFSRKLDKKQGRPNATEGRFARIFLPARLRSVFSSISQFLSGR